MTKQFKTRLLICLVLLFIFIFPFLIVSAATTTGPNLEYAPMEPLPGFAKTADFATFISNLYKFGIWTVGICALIMIVIGGYMYAASGGNNASMEKAKKFITDALVGLILALLAYLILYIINPELVKIKMAAAVPSVSYPKPDNCTGSAPNNSTICTSTSPTTETAVSLVATCASAPCTYGCNADYKISVSGSQCIAVTPPPTTGLTKAEKDACSKIKNNQKPSQCQDASLKLNTLLSCMNEKFGETMEVSSISDGNGGVNCYQDHKNDNPPWIQCAPTKQTYCCFHGANSCHYGKNNEGKSYAVDISKKSKADLDVMAKYAKESCGSGYTKVEDNPKHLHISASGCNAS